MVRVDTMRRLVPAAAFVTGAAVGGLAAIGWVVWEDWQRDQRRSGRR